MQFSTLALIGSLAVHFESSFHPPNETLVRAVVVAFQAVYPDVRIQVFITERIVDQIVEGIDLAFRVDEKLHDSSLVAIRLLKCRHLLVASPEYLKSHKRPKTPKELLGHRLLAFSFWRPENTWKFGHVNRKDRSSITFKPFLSINEYSGLATRAPGWRRNWRLSSYRPA